MVDPGKLAEVLSEFARSMTNDASMVGIVDRLVECIVRVLPVTAAGAMLIVPGVGSRYIVGSNEAARLFEELQVQIGAGPAWIAEQTGEAVTITDLHADGRFPELAVAAAGGGPAGVFSFPLRHDYDRFGSIDLYQPVAGGLDAQAMVVAQTLADVTAAYLAIAAARDHARADAENLKQTTLRDPLTGLPNRRSLEDRIEHAAEHARRNHTGAAILFADLDEFKHVNDFYGHAVGDELLVAVAARMSTLLRSSDTVARISGDEFVFLCEDLASPADVDLITGRIADAFTVPFEWLDYEFTLTVSVGVAYAAAGEQISTHLVAEADKAMYAAKRSRCVQ